MLYEVITLFRRAPGRQPVEGRRLRRRIVWHAAHARLRAGLRRLVPHRQGADAVRAAGRGRALAASLGFAPAAAGGTCTSYNFV